MSERVPTRFEQYYELCSKWFAVECYPTKDDRIDDARSTQASIFISRSRRIFGPSSKPSRNCLAILPKDGAKLETAGTGEGDGAAMRELGPESSLGAVLVVSPDGGIHGGDDVERILGLGQHCLSLPPHGVVRVLIHRRSARRPRRCPPINVRATDLSEFLEQTDQRAKDHRSYDALGGLAIPRLAVARIDELLDVVSDHGLVFAPELAHLAFFHLAPEKRTEVEPIFGEAAEIGWVAEAYALENPDEFFAVSYTDWLRATLNLPLRREPDEAGMFDAVGRVFSELAQG